MTNRCIAQTLFNIATLLDMAQDNVYRVRAYRRAARRVLALPEPATAIVARGQELPLPGVGRRIRRKLAELIGSGSLAFYQDLIEDLPCALWPLMTIEGMGPKTAQRLQRELGISTPLQLLAAAEQGRIRALPGFGPRSEHNLALAARQALSLSQQAA